MTKKLFPAILLLLLLLPKAQSQQEYPVIPFATQGTDFWVAFPWNFEGMTWGPKVYLAVVAERDCDLTIANERLDFHRSYHIMRRFMAGPDTNIIELDFEWVHNVDTLVAGLSPSQQPANQPNNMCFHITTTDTVGVFAVMGSYNKHSPVNLLPTEMLRDEYVLQAYPHEPHGGGNQKFAIVATEDNTVVDIVLTDSTWVGQMPGDTVSVTLQRGQFYYLRSAYLPEDYIEDPSYRPQRINLPNHVIGSNASVSVCRYISDLSGTRIKARDHKRIAVFSGSSIKRRDFEQQIPVRYAGKEYVIFPIIADTIPEDARHRHNESYIRITALHNNTNLVFNGLYPVSLNANENYWAVLPSTDEPYYITANKPIVCYSLDSVKTHDTGGYNLCLFWNKPTEYWMNTPASFTTICSHDNNGNRYYVQPFVTHVAIKTEDRHNLRFDEYRIDSLYQGIPGSRFSMAHFNHWYQLNSSHGQGTHHFSHDNGARFYAIHSNGYDVMHVPHAQPSKCYLYIGNTLADSMPPNYGQCHTDSLHLRLAHECPADSIVWDFGDGTTLAGPSATVAKCSHLFATPGHYSVQGIVIYPYEGYFTRPYDTLSFELDIWGETDSVIDMTVCENGGYFRDMYMEYDSTYTYTAPGNGLECDTIFHINFVGCPHCRDYFDTILNDDLPYNFNGYVFGGAVDEAIVRIDIDDDCDSIIYYHLFVYMSDPNMDSTFILAPNIFTPNSDINNTFKVVCNKFIREAQVSVFDRRGLRITQFDGINGEWDGTHNGNPCPMGTYVYFIRYMRADINGWLTMKGTVTLIR